MSKNQELGIDLESGLIAGAAGSKADSESIAGVGEVYEEMVPLRAASIENGSADLDGGLTLR